LTCWIAEGGTRRGADLNAADEERRAAGTDGARVQKSRDRADDVLIEHRQILEHAGVDGDRIQIAGRAGGGGAAARHRQRLRHAFDRHRDGRFDGALEETRTRADPGLNARNSVRMT
jgi:hypothetical protein